MQLIRLVWFLMLVFIYVLTTGTAWAGEAQAAPDYSRLQAELESELQGAEGEYGLYLIDVNSGAALGVNEREVFHGASTYKVPLNLYLFSKVAAGEVNPERYLEYKEEHFEGGTGYLQSRDFGTRYRIAQLSRDSIVYSDNVATNMLLDDLGYYNVKNFTRFLGAEVVDDEQNITCPRDMAHILLALVRFANEHPAEGGQLLHYMRTSIFRDGIPAAVPGGIPVANKIGYWPATGTYNDVAYVEHPTRPYVLAIYSKNTPGQAAAFAQIRRLTSIIHDFQDSDDQRVTLTWNDQEPVLTDPPVLRLGRVEVPVRALIEALPELGLTWNTAEGELIIYSRTTEKEASFRPGHESYRVYNGRSYLTLRTFAEALGYSVSWDAENMAAVIMDP